jgi:tripartite-type tricarboxylate transporter receptor subunit TctC
MFPGLAAALPHIRSGRVKPLAITGVARQATVKDVPTLIESGFKGFDAVQWYGVVGPAGMPAAVVARLHEEVEKALAATDVRERLASAGGEVAPGSSAMFAEMLQREQQRYARLIRESNIKPE